MNSITCDFLVIGSGLAGLSAALELADHGQVIIATKKEKTECNSRYAQGGIACVMDPNDSEQAHTEDTLFSGCGLTDAKVTEQIIHQGKKRIRALEALGLSFDLRKGRETEYDLGQEGGHSHRRILHCGDITGGAIMQTLQTAIANKPNIQTLEHHIAIDLITTSWLHGSGKNQCVGAYFLNTESNEVFAIQARATLLATGGVGKVYPYTSNPDVATGDGLAMAWRAGLPIRNMEFIQFHPTCLYHPNAKSFLISEAVRGEGAQLIDKRGHAFMNEYDSRGSLATRDITARAIDAVMKKSGDPYVYLDITHHSAEFLKERFPNLYAACLQYGIDMATDPIPVVPAAHYSCGGIVTGLDGSTSLEGLFAAGELASTGIHGANRLASNSLLEALVCGHNAGVAMQDALQTTPPTIKIPNWKRGIAVDSEEAVVVEHDWNEVRTCMWDYVGIVRTQKRLERARKRIRHLREEIQQYYKEYIITADLIELRNLTDTAELIIRSALQRKESRGLHYMKDFPEPLHQAENTLIQDEPGGPFT